MRMVPGDIMLLLILIPSMLTAFSVVREKELGSIANFYAAPATRLEFLFGKQLPYFAVALIQFVHWSHSQSSVPGSAERKLGPSALGGVIYVLASTGFGLLISVFAPTQTAAIFAAAIITILPAIQFSGMFVPVSSLTGGACFAARIFPSTYFQAISVGTFTKALGFGALWRDIVALAYSRSYLLRHVRRAAEEAGRLDDAAPPPHLSARHQGTAQPFSRSGLVVSDLLFFHVFGLHALEERRNGRDKCLGRGRR